MPTVTVYGAYCPLGESCSKKGRLLCKHTDLERARASLLAHLLNSPYHQDIDEETKQLLASDDMPSWEEDWVEEDAAPEAAGSAEPDAKRRKKQPESVNAKVIASAVATGVREAFLRMH